MLPVNFSFANCELYSAGFHTIADYNDSDVITYKLIHPFVFLLSNPGKKALKISLNGKLCKEVPVEEVTSTSGTIITYKIKTCFKSEPIPDVGQGRIVGDTFYLRSSLDLSPTGSNEKLEGSIIKDIQNQKIVGSGDYEIKKQEIKNYSFKHTEIDKKGTIFSMVTLHLAPKDLHGYTDPYRPDKELRKVSELEFYLVYLSRDGKVWFIAESTQKHCSDEVKWNLDFSGDYGKAVLGYPLKVFKSFDTNGDEYSDQISFGSDDLFYFFEFGKRLSVIKKYNDRLELYNAD